MDTDDNSADTAIWNTICQLDHHATAEICTLLHRMTDENMYLQRALSGNNRRMTALHILLVSQDINQKKTHFPLLVELASVAHSDISLCRYVIKSLPLNWVRENIMPVIATTLQKVADIPADVEEAYLRLAELLYELDPSLLKIHIAAALRHPVEGVREVGRDFTTSTAEH